ncbi:hypothetical protein SAMN05444285_104102 [Draconibacterium orientale]|jgi:hypothetical protein|uniref:GLPGLI family protein n=1 Tax=Draconibacterium orientale TaxID=1168034 RepID=X5DL50_9BACT|nr:hypothetical protein [Draconibacterium orientale]AHW61979.1 hypothetical protein FH5T_12510 [Draconibacterium orientale]SES98414.1 hypothetical protein SAMN05444285_104102 [Draconibacterium orientale]
MKKLSVTLLLVIVCIAFAQAQYLNYEIIEKMDYLRTNQMTTNKPSPTIAQYKIEGSPYLDDAFVNGTIYTTAKTQVPDVPLRYNIYNDNLEFKTSDGTILELAHPETVERAKLGETEMIFTNYLTTTNSTRKGFFKLLAEGDLTLLAKPDIFYQEAKEEAAYKEAQPPKFIPKPDEYYMQKPGAPAIKIRKSKDMDELIDQHQKEIDVYIKKNKIKFKNAEDLTQLVEYYNSL